MRIKKSALFVRFTTFAVFAGGSVFGSYVLTPNRTVKVNTGSNMGDQSGDDSYSDSYFNKFVSHLMNSIDENSDETFGNLNASMHDFSITWPSNSGVSLNELKFDGLLNLSMTSLKDLDVTLQLNAELNGKDLDLSVGLVDETLYLAIKDLKIKSSYSNTETLFNTVHDLFFNSDNPNGLGITFTLPSISDLLGGQFDLTTLDLESLKIQEEVEGDLVNIDVKIMEGIEINLVLDKETLGLRKVDLGTIQVGDVSIKGVINCDTPTDYIVYPFDDPLYPGLKKEGFVEAINYIGWADSLLEILQTRKTGLNLNATISSNDGSNAKLFGVNARVDLDVSKLFDIKNLNINDLLDRDEDSDDSLDITSKLLNDICFGLNANISGKKEEIYSNIGLVYSEQNGYLTLNENGEDSVMKVALSVDGVKEIVEKIPEFVSTLTGEDKKATKATNNLFDFITSSSLVNAIKEGQYEEILDLIKTFKNTNTTVELELDLSLLGFGEYSTVSLVLDASENAITNGSKILDLKLENIELGSLLLNAELSSEKFSNSYIEKVLSNKSEYDKLDFVVGVIDQISTLVNTKSAYVGIDGSLLDDNGLGFNFYGWLQFSLSSQMGFGSIDFDEYKSNPNKISAKHKIDIDVDDSGENDRDKNMLFEYREKLKGKFTVQTLRDMFSLVESLLNDDDERFTKFTQPLKDSLATGVIGQILESEDYLELTKASYIKSIKMNDDGSALTVVISKSLLSLKNDLKIRINFNLSKNKQIDSIELLDLALGEKTLNLKLSVSEYKEDLKTPVNKNSTFYDFSDIAILLQFGINTTKLNFYHLKMPLKVIALGFIPLNVTLDFYVEVNGVSVRVYGYIPKVPYLTSLASDDNAFTSVRSEFAFETDKNASGNDIGGYFYIARTEDHVINSDDATYYYRADISCFGENILQYLLCGLLNFKKDTADSIGNLGGDTVEDSDYENLFTDKGFVYSYDGTTHKWNIGLNLASLTGNSKLGDLIIELNGIDVNGVGYYSNATFSTKLTSLLKIEGTLTLVSPDPTIMSWGSDIESKFNNILNVYRNLSASDKEYFDSHYFNNPNNPYRASMFK